MARDKIVWKPQDLESEGFGRRKVYVRHVFVPAIGTMADPDTAFTIPAFIRVRGKRIRGYVEARDGLAWQQEHDRPWFPAFQIGVSSCGK